jgi:hypothetical protein
MENNNTKNLYILTWKPEFGSYSAEQFNELKKILRKEGSAKTPWSVRAAQVVKNDFVVLFRQGQVTGLYGFGHIFNSSEIIEKDGSKKVEVVLTNLRDSIDQPFFSKQDLIRQGFNEKLLNAQSSAQGSVPTDQAQTLNQILINKYGFGLDRACFEYCIDKIQKIIKQ